MKVNKPELAIGCVLTFDNGDKTQLTCKDAKLLEKVIRKTIHQLYPDHRVRGLWVHESAIRRER
jgi:hypothetical protein